MTISKDLKEWHAISCPVKGLSFDKRTLELLDTDNDGHIRTDEVLSAIELIKNKGESFKADDETLAKITARIEELNKLEPPNADETRLVDCAKSLAAIEDVVDKYFIPEDCLLLISDDQPKSLPLKGNVNFRYLEAFSDFCEKCIWCESREKDTLTFLEWKALKAKYAPYRGGITKPAADSDKAKASEDERICRYKMHLDEFLRNYVSMDDLYSKNGLAMFQMGVLRIDGREMSLCFHVEDEAKHSALSGRSKCFVIYLSLARSAAGEKRNICAVVTAGTIAGLYVGRNGVFYDRDGRDWEAVITKVVENQISLAEAFWSPWKKVGETISDTIKKFLTAKQSAALGQVTTGVQDRQAGGAALASSVAAIGIGVGMVGAAFASVMAAVSRLTPLQVVGSVAVIVLLVSLPSMILTWFNLRKRDIGAILNASGWAINREMRFSMTKAREFTRCTKVDSYSKILISLAFVAVAIVIGIWYHIGNENNVGGLTENRHDGVVNKVMEVK